MRIFGEFKFWDCFWWNSQFGFFSETKENLKLVEKHNKNDSLSIHILKIKAKIWEANSLEA